jgi:serine/threonine-protein kinase RsbW
MKPSTVPATLDSLGAIADYVMAAAALASLDRRASYRLRLAVDEIATNIIVHGYANAEHQGMLELRADIDDKALTIVIDDTGVTYDPRQAPIPDINLPIEQRPVGGLGVYLAMRSVDEFLYEQLGDRNRTIFKMHLPSSSLEEDKA